MMAASMKSILKKLAPDDDMGSAEEATHETPLEEIDLKDVDGFLNSDNIPGLDDHLETVFNPIMMYKLKLAKEEARKEKIRAQLIADGYDPDAMDADDAAAVAGGAGAVRNNALFTLISAGARVTPISASQSAEAAAREDKKRQLRNIDSYLAKNMEADVARVPLAQRKQAYRGTKYTTALEMARRTAVQRVGGDSSARLETVPNMAKSARNQLRFLKSSRPDMFAKMMPSRTKSDEDEDDAEEDDDGNDDDKLQRRTRAGTRAGTMAINSADLEAIQAEYAEVDEEDEDEPQDDDDAKLAA